MKIQSEFYSLENGVTHHEQYFTSQTKYKLEIEDWQRINEFIQDVTELMSKGEHVQMRFKILGQ
jgi:hypothetical protein